jgi:hypothetical protein
MPARIVMVNGDKLVVDMDEGKVADRLRMDGPWSVFDVANGTAARQVYLASLNVAYVEEYEAASAEPFVETVG